MGKILPLLDLWVGEGLFYPFKSVSSHETLLLGRLSIIVFAFMTQALIAQNTVC